MASTDAKAVPVKNAAYRATFPILDADGDLVSGASGLDSEVSIDAGTFADCTNEATEIATSSGMYYLDLTSGEMNGDTIAIIVKTSTVGAKTTPMVLYTAARSINDLAFPTTTGRSIDVTTTGGVGIDWANVENPTTSLNLSATTIGTAAALTTNNDKTGYRLSATGVDDVWDEATSGHTTAGTTGKALIDASAAGTPPTTAAIADAVWDEARAGHVGAGSFGEGVVVNSIASGAITATAIATDAIGAAELSDAAAEKIADTVAIRGSANWENDVEIGSIGEAALEATHNSDTTTNAGYVTIFAADGVTPLYKRLLATDTAAEPLTGVGQRGAA